MKIKIWKTEDLAKFSSLFSVVASVSAGANLNTVQDLTARFLNWIFDDQGATAAKPGDLYVWLSAILIVLGLTMILVSLSVELSRRAQKEATEQQAKAAENTAAIRQQLTQIIEAQKQEIEALKQENETLKTAAKKSLPQRFIDWLRKL